MNGDHAHQWAEIALDGFGWITLDPTPGGAPSRMLPASSLEQTGGEQTGGEQTGGEQTSGETGSDETGSEETASASRETASASRETAPEEESLQKGPGTGDESVSDVRESEEERATLEGIALHDLAVALDPWVRKEAALLLGEIGSGIALEGLAKAMFNDPIKFVRAAAIEGMTMADYEQLVKILLEHEDALLRKAAATALGKKDDARALSPLGEALHTDADTGVRAAAAEALGVLGEEGALGLLARALVTEADVDEEVRAAAAAALGELKLPEAVAPLLEALAADAGPEVREAAANALCALGDDGASDQLAQILADDEDAGVRAAAAVALGDLGPPGALSPLMQARAGDESSTVRSCATAALDRYLLSQLTGALQESAAPTARAAAAELLGERGNPSAAPVLIETLNDLHSDVQEAAMAALEKLGAITPLENGSRLLSHSAGVSFIPATTTQQATELPHLPVFEVRSATDTGFLRVAVGDRYSGGLWSPDDQVG